MLESFMEDLLWRFPDDFFTKHGHRFTQADRQFTLSDGGRLDISFRDARDRLWVVEVKAVPLRIGVADQVIRYVQQLRDSHPNEVLVPAVVAPVINSVVEDQLIRWSIEPFQISEAEFRRVAEDRGILLEQIALAPILPQATARGKTKLAAGRRETDDDLIARLTGDFMKSLPTRLRAWVNARRGSGLSYPEEGAVWRSIRFSGGRLLFCRFLERALECFVEDPNREFESRLRTHFGVKILNLAGRRSPNKLDWQEKYKGWNFLVDAEEDFSLLTSILASRLGST